ncbi:hypothetical protein BZA77DRAFT_45152 [Pyronema omphalodes]|nr:hypothetical protein BZA77DRAFT_45152 [Pyronema omphalodes]
MAELAGLVLGAIGLAVPIYEGMNALSKRISDTKSFPKTLRRLKTELTIKKDLFYLEYVHLFPSEIEETVAKAMLADINHPNWKNIEFEDMFRCHLGPTFERICDSITLIHETMMLFQKEVDRVAINPKGGVAALLKKFHHSSEADPLRSRLGELRDQLADLRSLRKARQDALGRQTLQKGPKPASDTEEIEFRKVQELQKASKRVYTAVSSVASCNCHSFFFQLHSDTTSCKPTTPEFKIVLANDSSCTCVAFRTESSPAGPPPYILPAAQPPSEKPKRARFADDDNDNSLTTLTDLCRSISTAIVATAPSYLGALPSADPHRHLYTDYHKPSMSKMSLPAVFCQPPISRLRPVFPLQQRYRLAWIISSSFLRFGFFNAAWFRSNWRSEDIYFLTEKVTSKELELPYLSIVFNKGEQKKGTCLAKNEALYSLAIALIEIAFADTIRNLVLNGEEGEWNHYKEYTGAKQLVEEGAIKEQCGKRYAQVVQRCFWGELMEGMEQKGFYKNVECELRTCLNEFMG